MSSEVEVLSQRGITGALYLAALCQILIFARIDLTVSIPAWGIAAAVCAVILGLVVIHVLFELFGFVSAIRSKVAGDSMDRTTYPGVKCLREDLLSGNG